ncbi:MAG: adenylate/guanylate cyclase domain-containing protein [Spirochaetes bacterium]|nr:adenylate/guanylate cyclase domain-containing protein [Spirochaetota bacterium]
MATLVKGEGPVDIRRIRFGLRVKFLLLLSLIVILVISVLSTIMYFNQRNLLIQEKNTKANVLTHLLSGPAEFYLDKTVQTSDEESAVKYQTISREAESFKNFNDDIEKIVLSDQNGKIRFSTSRGDYRRKKALPYIKKSLEQNEEKPEPYDFQIKIRARSGDSDGDNEDEISFFEEYITKIRSLFPDDSENNKTEIIKLRAITYPIFLHKGNVVDILNDFNKYYIKYHTSGLSAKKKIYSQLWKKYSDSLDKSFSKKKLSRRQSGGISKRGDIDFLFHSLFGEIMKLRDIRVSKNDRWLFREAWLVSQKKKIDEAYARGQSEKAKEINDVMITRMQLISKKVEEVRRLGALAIIFNVNKIEAQLDKTIYSVMILAVVMVLVCLIAFRIILNLMIKNLEKLERWAVSVSSGNLDTKIVINTNDEIGRLGDIFNNMIDQIAVKYNLEKFLSSSAISMLGKKSDSGADLKLGHTERRDLVFLFSDVRGFTSFSEKNDPSIVMEVLNFYLELQSNIIISNKGDIDNFIGDEIMAHFRGENKVERAIDSAVKIMNVVAKENVNRMKEKLPIFEVGIGINKGDVVIGTIGTTMRMVFTCIGDAVNLSARLCSSAGPGEILISKETIEESSRIYNTINTAPIAVKGKEKPVRIVKIKI